MARTRSLAGSVALMTGLLIAAGVASRGRPLSRSGWSVSGRTLDIVMAAGFGVVAALVVGLALESHRPGSTARRRSGVGDVLFALALVAVVLAGSYGLGRALHPSAHPERVRGVPCVTYELAHGKSASVCQGRRSAPPLVAKRARHSAQHASPFAWLAVGVIAALLAMGAGMLLVERRRSAEPRVETDEDGRTAVLRALDLSIDDLQREPDARRAIIAAYARMENAFARVGLPRRPAEAPHEFLVRSLRELDTSGDAAARLTELFELAKFSDHAATLPMRDDALDALVAVRDELAVVPV